MSEITESAADEDDGYDRPSKSQVKREMLALTELGKQLIALSPERLRQPCTVERLDWGKAKFSRDVAGDDEADPA